MKQVFKVELSHSDMQNEACATVSLPATAAETIADKKGGADCKKGREQ